MDEKKRIIEFDAASEVPVDGQMAIDSASQGTKKITPALLLKAITDLLGDEALETLAQTLTGAVNEVKGIADDAQDLAENISDEYSSSSAYAKGDYCIHNNTLYKCTTAIGSGGEAWNASHWSATKCDDELSELKGTLDDNTFNTWSDNTRCEFISGGYISMGAYMLVNVVFKAKATATNTPSLVSISPQKPKVDTALNAIDITSGIASSIAESIPCGIASSNGTIFIKKIETDHIYAITGYYLIN